MRGAAKPFLITVVVIIALIALMDSNTPQGPDSSTTLHIFCAAGIKVPVAAIAKAYEEEYGVQIQLDFEGSGSLLSKLEVRQEGDIYIAADSSYTDIAVEKGLVQETLPACLLVPVIAVPKGNPKNIHGVQDLYREDIRISLANPDAASVGKTTKKLLSKLGYWEKVEAAVKNRGVFKPTVPEVANDLKLGTVDAAIVWDVTVNQYPELDAIALESSDEFKKNVTVGILTASKSPTEALRFARYMNAPSKGGVIFEANGFPPLPGDEWTESPEILYYSGGVNRVAIKDTLASFQEREGITITTIYNGCGILLGQIKGGGQPDMYHTCDVSFMEGVESQFTQAKAISQTDIVIIVPKGNPKNIRTLADLAKGPLQLGVCNEEQSTLGAMTEILLRDQGLYDAVQKNVVVNTPTADLLVSQLVVGQLEAAIVYKANTTKITDKADIVPIELDGAIATQTVAIAQQTKYPMLLQRLEAALNTSTSKEQFQMSGFDWVSADTTP